MIEELKTIGLVEGLAARLYELTPKLGLSFLTLIVGLFVAAYAGKAVAKLLKRLGLDEASKLTGLQSVFGRVGIRTQASEFLGSLLKYALYIVVVMLSFDILGIHIIGNVFAVIFGYLPRIVGAVAILILGLILAGVSAELVGRGIRGAGVDAVAQDVGIKFGMADLAEAMTRYVLYVAVAMISLSALAINTTVLLVLLTVVGGSVALAGSLLLVFSFKDLGPDLAAGVYLETKKIMKPGSTIKFKSISGTVKNAGLVFTTVETKSGTVRIPNKLLLEEEFTVGQKN